MWFATLVAFLGLMSDSLVYSIIIPIIPFKLEQMGYRNISGRVGWLLFAYSAGVVISTPPLASYSERFKNRQIPLILSLTALTLSQLLLMLAQRYWVMCVARFIEGISSSGVLAVGLALICDSTPKKRVGQQIGIAMAGLSIGLLVGPPVAGTLDAKFGYRSPFYFGMAFSTFDLLVRLLVIERKDAIKWGVDPAADPDEVKERSLANDSRALSVHKTSQSVGSSNPFVFRESKKSEIDVGVAPVDETPQHSITPLDVLFKILTSARAMVCVFSTFVYGFMYSGQETVLVVHLARVYGLGAYESGLAFVAAVIPTLISMPLGGYFSDNKGAEWVAFVSLLFGIPFWGIITIHCNLVQFLAIFAIEILFTSALVSPLLTELAAVSRSIEGVGYAHVYGCFNLAYGIGTSVGPILSGQIYDTVSDGWTVISILILCHLVVCLFLSLAFTGERPLLRRALGHFDKQGEGLGNTLGMRVLGDGPMQESGSRPEISLDSTPPIAVPQRAHWKTR